MLGYINDGEHTFLSNAFMIRYWDEEVDLSHVVQFRTELDLIPGWERTPYYLDVELLFTEIAAVGGAEFAMSLFSLEVSVTMVTRRHRGRTH